MGDGWGVVLAADLTDKPLTPPPIAPGTEQLEIVQRMHRSYRFLQAQHFGMLSGITG